MEKIRKLTVKSAKEYTPIRRFYAWTGFLAIMLGVPLILFGLIAASHFVARELAGSDEIVVVYEDGSYKTRDGQVGCLYPQYGCTPDLD